MMTLLHRDLVSRIRSALSLRLRARSLDDLSPLLGLFGDQASERSGRERHGRAAELGDARLYLGVGQARADLAVEPLDHVGRRALGRADAGERASLETRHELAHRRYVR